MRLALYSVSAPQAASEMTAAVREVVLRGLRAMAPD
jgi:hypothetical protein